LVTPRPQPFWSQEVGARVIKLQDRLPGVDDDARESIAGLIGQADELRSDPGRLFTWKRLADWWYGSRVEQAWSLLHEAELLIIDHSTKALFPALVEDAVGNAAVLDQTDPARVRLEKWINTNGSTSIDSFA